jgi:DNA-binding PadR family transcriptional regulator
MTYGQELNYQIIGVLAQGDPRVGTYGLDIARQVNKHLGSIVPNLVRLEQQGYIERRWQGEGWPSDGVCVDTDPGDGSRRRYYRPTDAGRQARAEWMAAQQHRGLAHGGKTISEPS